MALGEVIREIEEESEEPGIDDVDIGIECRVRREL